MSTRLNLLRRDFAATLEPGTAATAALARLDAAGPRLVHALEAVYGDRSDLDSCLADWATALAGQVNARPQPLRELDRQRAPGWFAQPETIGYSAYVDRFAGTLSGVAERIPYLQQLGVRYLHLLPFLRARAGDNDGGFAVSDYGRVEPALGSNADLWALCERLRTADISLCSDLVLNHCADDHPWAVAAKAGSARHRRMFRLFASRAEVDALEAHLPQVFPETAPGNFTFVPELDAWVWTTFYPYQWDLDWSNPEVFAEMSLALLRLANLGVEAFRLDSAAYLFKRPGTGCVNQPENHSLLQALRAVVDIVAPSVLLKAEAIMPMRALPPYFGADGAAGHECHLAYHSSLMAGAWAALSCQRGDIAGDIIARTPALPDNCAWIDYVRCHDDIGWQVLREEADAEHGFDLYFVAEFFAGRTVGSYALGAAFQSGAGNAAHGSNGMAAALVGLTPPPADPEGHTLALRRLLLLHGLALSASGVPLIYMGDELGLGNDTDYIHDPVRRAEGRWLHRPAMDWTRADAAVRGGSNEVWDGLQDLIAVRRATPDLAPGADSRVLDCGDRRVLALRRGERFLGLYNFSAQTVDIVVPKPPGTDGWHNAFSRGPLARGTRIEPSRSMRIEPYGLRWLIGS